MRQLIEISLAFVDLLEAKLEQVNRGVLNLGIALGLVFVASALAHFSSGVSIVFGLYSFCFGFRSSCFLLPNAP